MNLASLAPQSRDELDVPGSARSTASARSWLTDDDDKWSDDDDDNDASNAVSGAAAAAAASSSLPKFPASKAGPPVGMLNSYFASGSASRGLNGQVIYFQTNA